MRKYTASKLKNGLTVITSEDKSTDIATVSFWFKAGSRYESESERGYAHILEHILLKGSKNFPSMEEVGTKIDNAGALWNAKTSADAIQIYAQVAEDNLQNILEIIADGIVNPLFDPETIETEKKVIIEELHQFNNNRAKVMWAESISKVFPNDPASNNPVGDESSILSATPEKLRAYYQRFITPSNGILTITSSLSSKLALELANSRLATWETSAKSAAETTVMPVAQPKTGIEFIKSPAKQVQLFFNFPCPNINYRDLIGLHLITNTIGYGKNPLLKSELRHKNGLVYGVGAYIFELKNRVVFYISTASTNPEEVIKEIKNVVANLVDGSIGQDIELHKKKFRYVLLRRLDDALFESEFLWINWKMHDDIIFPEQFLDVLDSLTPDELIAIRHKYINPDNLLITAFGQEAI